MIIKQLFEDASELSSRQDGASLTRAITILDLSVELALKNLIVSLNPTYFNKSTAKKDLNFYDSWRVASEAVKGFNGAVISDQNEMFTLHELRNLVQHRGLVPSQVDTVRFATATRRMLTTTFRDAFSYDFENLRVWDFINNKPLRKFIKETEQLITDGEFLFGIAFCKKIADNVIAAIGEINDINFYRSYPSDSDVAREFKTRSLTRFLGDLRKYIEQRFEDSEKELVLTGLGMSILDTRKFIGIGSLIFYSEAYNGEMSFTSRVHDVEKYDGNLKLESTFMLNYLFRLLVLIGDKYASILETIQFKRFPKEILESD